MKLLVVSQYFEPEIAGGAHRMSALARHLAQLGCKVEVIAPVPNYPNGEVPPSYRRNPFGVEERGGVRIQRTWIPPLPTSGVWPRLALQGAFLGAGLTRLGRVKGATAVISNLPTLGGACLGALLAQIASCPHLLYIGDLYPESIEANRALKHPWLLRPVYKLVKSLYKSAAAIAVTTAGQRRRLIETSVPASKVHVLYNGAEPFTPPEAAEVERIRNTFGLQGKQVILYSGSLGVSQRLETVLEAAALLKARKNMLFLLVGTGSREGALKRYARQLDLQNVRFVGQVKREKMPAFYRLASLGLVVLNKAPLFREVLPSKVFDYLAAGVPVVASAQGETADLLARASAGVAVPPEAPLELARAIEELLEKPALLERFRRAGPAFIASGFTRQAMAERMLEVVHSVLEAKSGLEYLPALSTKE